MLNKTLMLDRFVFSFPLFINNCFTEDFPVAHYAQPGWGGGGFNNLRGGKVRSGVTSCCESVVELAKGLM